MCQTLCQNRNENYPQHSLRLFAYSLQSQEDDKHKEYKQMKTWFDHQVAESESP